MRNVRPEDLRIDQLAQIVARKKETLGGVEVILATNLTAEGQATAHIIAETLKPIENIRVSRLSYGIPAGGELDYLDDGTLIAALSARAPLS